LSHLFRRLRACDAGAGLIEYSLLIALAALGLTGVLAIYRNAVEGLTDRTAVTVSRQAGGGYAARPAIGGGGGVPRGGTAADDEDEEDEENDPMDPDSTSAAGHISGY
jgi:Flp pilus assembly pilin Flp